MTENLENEQKMEADSELENAEHPVEAGGNEHDDSKSQETDEFKKKFFYLAAEMEMEQLQAVSHLEFAEPLQHS